MKYPNITHIGVAGAFALALAAASESRAQSTVAAFWSFDTKTDPAGTDPGTTVVTASTFETLPTLSYAGSNIGLSGGAISFTAFDGTTWKGSGRGSRPGNSLTWSSLSTGNSFSVTLDTRGVSSLNVRMDIRSYTGGLTSFSDLQYDTGSGWVSSGLTLDSIATGDGFPEWSVDLSSLAAINNRQSIKLRWVIGDIPKNNSLRVDNLQITATATQ
ncbi:MAG: hypothetical protein LBK99_07320 [Opitutaceae bacterium]|nr:hypothetical protein [Opitutaceae bacterium]